ncbi:MAG: hypothetical protein SNJ55_14100 [Chloroherpetonaceae bacterium]
MQQRETFVLQLVLTQNGEPSFRLRLRSAKSGEILSFRDASELVHFLDVWKLQHETKSKSDGEET